MFFTQEGGNRRYLTEMRRTCSSAYTEGSAMHEGHLLRRFFYVFVFQNNIVSILHRHFIYKLLIIYTLLSS